jgi:hypothetical protein
MLAAKDQLMLLARRAAVAARAHCGHQPHTPSPSAAPPGTMQLRPGQQAEPTARPAAYSCRQGAPAERHAARPAARAPPCGKMSRGGRGEVGAFGGARGGLYQTGAPGFSATWGAKGFSGAGGTGGM